MNLKAILVLFASLFWFFGCHYWYCCKVRSACYGCAPAKVEVAAQALAPLSFKWSDNKTITSKEFEEYKANIVAKDQGDNILEIVGQYSKDEVAPEGYDNMGIARASKIRELFLSDLPEERIRLVSKMVEEKEGMRTTAFSSAGFNWIKPKMEKAEVVELSDRAVILFPTNSSRKEANPKIDAYLTKVASQLQSANKKVLLIGHTDSQGLAAKNLKLSRDRANSIRSFLRAKGVPDAKISIESKGQTDPVANNDTEEGRHQNRRVEIRIIE